MKVLLMMTMCLVVFTAWAGSAARVDDLTSTGGKVQTGSANVKINNKSSARVGDSATCLVSNPFPNYQSGPIVTGSNTVLINGKSAATVGSLINTVQTCTISTGSSTVLIGN